MSPKPLEIFVVAEQFYWAGETLARIPLEAAREQRPSNPYYMIGVGLPNMSAAAVTCRAFSLELYFKCLIRIGRKPPDKNEHDLVKLFNKIGYRHRAAIRRYFRQNSEDTHAFLARQYAASGRPAPKLGFDFALSASANAFVRMRYIYEGLSIEKGWLADVILVGARGVILAKYPNWIGARQTSFLTEVIVRQ